VSAAAVGPVDVAARAHGTAPPGDAASALSGREASLRSAAAAGLAAIALIQALELPSASARSATLALLSFAAIALCVGVALALVAAGAGGSPAVWRAVAGTGALVLAGWALPPAVVLLRATGAGAGWAAMPGVACAGLGGRRQTGLPSRFVPRMPG
jgi:hypothetical protein